MSYSHLSREELIPVIERRACANRVPVIFHYLVYPESFGENAGLVRNIMGEYPQDAQVIVLNMPEVFTAPIDDPFFKWIFYDVPDSDQQRVAYDARVAIDDFDKLDEIIEHFPNPLYPGIFSNDVPDDGRYRLGYWWHFLFERHWQLRGMENALMDYYTDPEKVHILFRKLTEFYKEVIIKGRKEYKLDGIFVTDDLGMQTGPFFSPEIFDKFFSPYYREIVDTVHSLGMHFWLHSCGCIEPFLSRLIEVGVDVIHPIQKYTMDERAISKKYGGDICIWAGFDVQRIIPWGTAQGVRDEVKFMIDTYFRKNGGFMLASGNAIQSDCRIDSFIALHEEMYRYGTQKAQTSL